MTLLLSIFYSHHWTCCVNSFGIFWHVVLFLCYTLCIVENEHFPDQSSDSVRPESGWNSAIAESSNDKNAEEAKDDSVDRLLSVQSNESDSKRFFFSFC